MPSDRSKSLTSAAALLVASSTASRFAQQHQWVVGNMLHMQDIVTATEVVPVGLHSLFTYLLRSLVVPAPLDAQYYPSCPCCLCRLLVLPPFHVV
jgi:hypothetical protein